jgi:hypothetical protein
MVGWVVWALAIVAPPMENEQIADDTTARPTTTAFLILPSFSIPGEPGGGHSRRATRGRSALNSGRCPERPGGQWRRKK